MNMYPFTFSTNSLFKVKELLKIHKPLPLAIICDFLRIKEIEEWSVERDPSTSVFFDSCNLLETKNNQAFFVFILKCDFDRK